MSPCPLSQNLKEGLIFQAGNVVAATAFNFVGGYAQKNWQIAKNAGDSVGMAIWAEGGAARTALHALMGGAVSSITGGDFKSGAIAAGASQAMAGALNSTFNDQPNLRQAFSQIVGLTAAGLAGADINKASWVALMADEYNRQLHQKEVLALEKLQEENPEKAYQLKAAACAIVHCSASVHPDDQKNYDALTKLEADGSGFKDAQSALFATGAFDEYSKWDQVNDGLLRNEESAQRTGNAGRAILGAAGAVAGYSGAIITSPACVTLVGCALPGISAAAGAASFLESWEATGRLFAPYEYTQGHRVLASFTSETYPGDVNPLRDYGTEAAKAAVEMVLLKGAGKYLEGTGSSILVSGVKKEGVVADGVIGASNTDKPVLPAWYREDSSAGASFNKTDGLPDGYRRVLNTRTGNAEVLAPDGQLYFDTGNGLKPKAGGNLAELAEAERRINGTKATGAAEVPATSAIARVGLRDDLAAQAGIPRNIAESPSSMWGKSIDDIKQALTLDGASLTPKPPLAGTSGKAQVFNVEGHPAIKEVEFHPGGGTHGDSPYYKLVSTEKIGNKNLEIRVIDPSPDFSPGTITRYQQYYDTQGNRLKYEGGEWKGWK
ncbi:DUF637 domain-containing protein [Pseudomonas zeae]|uniref:DUF637 domain-containing protein n=1 Tax=Pseudomonas zeae TaxID=2745510 RepID=UPI001CEC213E|nr:DUF637 domain-containing protein [Pseudomonas zeae]